MVQIIVFLIFINTVLCFQYELAYDTTNNQNVMATLEFENDDFESISTWKVSKTDLGLNFPTESVCYVKKMQPSIVCFCYSTATGRNSFGKCISPLFILDAIHKRGFQSDPSHQEMEGYEKEEDFEDEIRPKAMKAIKSVLHTFISRLYNEASPSGATDTLMVVCRERFSVQNQELTHFYNNGKELLDISKLKKKKFPQFAFLESGTILTFSLHEPLRELVDADAKGDPKRLLGVLLFEFYGNRDVFWCADSQNKYEECNEAELKRRFQEAIQAIRKKHTINQTFVDYSTNSAMNIEFSRSTDFRIETVYELLLFLALFVIPIIALCVYHSIPEKVDHTPLDPSQFSEISDVQILSRRSEYFDDTDKNE